MATDRPAKLLERVQKELSLGHYGPHWGVEESLKDLFFLVFKGEPVPAEDLQKLFVGPWDRFVQETLCGCVRSSLLVVSADVSGNGIQSLASAFVGALLADACGNMSLYWDECCSFLARFPEQAGALSRTVLGGHVVADAFLLELAVAFQSDATDWRSVRPADAGALCVIMERLGADLGDEFYDMARGLLNKNAGDYISSDSSVIRLFNIAKEPYRSFLFQNFKTLFKETRRINVMFASFVMSIDDPPKELMVAAVRKLSRGKEGGCALFPAAFQIPLEESGESLCKMLLWLESQKGKGKVHGLPSQWEFGARAIEVQVNNEALFKETAEARDRLESRGGSGANAIETLEKRLYALSKLERPEVYLFEKLAGADIPTESKGFFLRCVTVMSTGRWNHYGEGKVTALWGAPITDKLARCLLVDLSKVDVVFEETETEVLVHA